MQDVFATSTARGGRGGSGNAHGGEAHADAVAEGLGLAVAEADANGGRDFFNSAAKAGVAHASRLAIGQKAATAKSRAFGNSGTGMRSREPRAKRSTYAGKTRYSRLRRNCARSSAGGVGSIQAAFPLDAHMSESY